MEYLEVAILVNITISISSGVRKIVVLLWELFYKIYYTESAYNLFTLLEKTNNPSIV